MAQDLRRAKGEQAEPLEIEVSRAKKQANGKEAASEQLKAASSGEGELRQDFKKTEAGGLIGHDQKQKEKSPKEPLSRFSIPAFKLPSFNFSFNRKLVFFLVFLLVIAFGGFFYFNYFRGSSGGSLDDLVRYVPGPVRSMFGLSTSPDLELDIAQPDGGELWYKGEEYNVLWFTEGGAGEPVDIYLVQGTSSQPIASDVENLGRYSWRIPKDLEEADDYKVKIASADSKITDFSAAPFGISGREEATSTDETPGYSTLLELDDRVKVEASSTEDFSEVLSRAAQADFSLGTLREILVVDEETQQPLSLKDLFAGLGWGLPSSAWDFMDSDADYTLALYHQSELLAYNQSKRVVFAGKVSSPEEFEEVIRDHEGSLYSRLAPSFFLDLEPEEPFSDSFLVNDEAYPGVEIRYQNFPEPDLSIDYAVVKQNQDEGLFILTSSRESMYQAIDLIKEKDFAVEASATTSESASSDDPKTEDVGRITGELCYPAGGIPEDWVVMAEDIDSGETYKGTRIGESFEITDLPAASYHVYAEAQGLEGRYTKAVECGLGSECEDHSFIKVKLQEGQTKEEINPCDWYDFEE